MRALVVDDSSTMRAMITRILRKVGFDEVHHAGDGVEALEVLARVPRPHVVLVDWNMPRMTGPELVRALRGDAAFADLPTLMVTTESEVERILAALEAGADEFLMKPFTPATLQGKLALLGVLEAA